MHRYEPMAGERIADTCRELALLAEIYGEACATFNEVEIIAKAGTTSKQLEKTWSAEMDHRRRAYEESPEGKRAAREAEAFRAKAETEAAKGILPFDVANQELWDECRKNNLDGGYGECVLRYAARWANLMEQRIVAGATVEQIAKETSSAADVEGITGFMYGCAVSMLSRVWRHGEQLRRWHNLDTQIGNEGEKANESGGVLNPALLRIG